MWKQILAVFTIRQLCRSFKYNSQKTPSNYHNQMHYRRCTIKPSSTDSFFLPTIKGLLEYVSISIRTHTRHLFTQNSNICIYLLHYFKLRLVLESRSDVIVEVIVEVRGHRQVRDHRRGHRLSKRSSSRSSSFNMCPKIFQYHTLCDFSACCWTHSKFG